MVILDCTFHTTFIKISVARLICKLRIDTYVKTSRRRSYGLLNRAEYKPRTYERYGVLGTAKIQPIYGHAIVQHICIYLTYRVYTL